MIGLNLGVLNLVVCLSLLGRQRDQVLRFQLVLPVSHERSGGNARVEKFVLEGKKNNNNIPYLSLYSSVSHKNTLVLVKSSNSWGKYESSDSWGKLVLYCKKKMKNILWRSISVSRRAFSSSFF